MNEINVNQRYKLEVTKRTIDWLVNNTEVAVFQPVDFTGYQRQIDSKHCQRIVGYLNKNSFLPSSIICSYRSAENSNKLWIVDGQHRVHAFRLLRESNIERYREIADAEIPVVVMIDVPIEVEIETFININKTSRKVDTSLAIILKNLISQGRDNMAMPKSEFISVEVARKLGFDGASKVWNGRILLEGNVRNHDEFISLNAFVRATRVLINLLAQKGVINLDWHSQEEVNEVTNISTMMIDYIWMEVSMRWSELFCSSEEDRRIIQGSIGYTAITRTLVKMLRDRHISNEGEMRRHIQHIVMGFSVGSEKWKAKGEYSRYSSESGYKIVSDELMGR